MDNSTAIIPLQPICSIGLDGNPRTELAFICLSSFFVSALVMLPQNRRRSWLCQHIFKRTLQNSGPQPPGRGPVPVCKPYRYQSASL